MDELSLYKLEQQMLILKINNNTLSGNISLEGGVSYNSSTKVLTFADSNNNVNSLCGLKGTLVFNNNGLLSNGTNTAQIDVIKLNTINMSSSVYTHKLYWDKGITIESGYGSSTTGITLKTDNLILQPDVVAGVGNFDIYYNKNMVDDRQFTSHLIKIYPDGQITFMMPSAINFNTLTFNKDNNNNIIISNTDKNITIESNIIKLLYNSENSYITVSNDINLYANNDVNIYAPNKIILNNLHLPTITYKISGWTGNAASISINNSTKNIDIILPGPSGSWTASECGNLVQDQLLLQNGIYLRSAGTNPPGIFINPYIIAGQSSAGIADLKPQIKNFLITKVTITDSTIQNITTIDIKANQFNTLNAEFRNQGCIVSGQESDDANSIQTIIKCLNNLEDRVSALED